MSWRSPTWPRSVRYSQTLVHHRARGGVRKELLLLWVEVVLDRERGQRRLVKPGEDQLLLPRIGIDVTDGEYARHARLELLRIDLERLPLRAEPPVAHRAELGMDPKEPQQPIRRERTHRAVGSADVDSAQRAVLDEQRVRQRLEEPHPPGRDQAR